MVAIGYHMTVTGYHMISTQHHMTSHDCHMTLPSSVPVTVSVVGLGVFVCVAEKENSS